MEMDRPLHNYAAGAAAAVDDVMDGCCYAFLTDDDQIYQQSAVVYHFSCDLDLNFKVLQRRLLTSI